jgi:tripartite-type tricarboxylate transporter receptor subunit TctC
MSARTTPLRRRLANVAAAVAGLLIAGAAHADYPERPIRILIPFAAGGATDVLARAIGQYLTQAWGQPVVPDNRPGANGLISTDMLAKSPPDGYTLSLVAIGHAVNPLLYKKLPYDTDRDFTPITLVATYPLVVMVPAQSPDKDLASLLQRARAARAAPLTAGNGGPGSSQQLATLLLSNMTGVTLTDVPYKGGNPALLAVAGGQLDLLVTLPSAQFLRGGKVRPLAVTSRARLPWLPDVPTVSEAGVPDYESVAWYGLIGPKGMPPELVRKIGAEVAKALATKNLREVAAAQGGVPTASTPEAFGAFLQTERKRYEPIVKAAHLSLD